MSILLIVHSVEELINSPTEQRLSLLSTSAPLHGNQRVLQIMYCITDYTPFYLSLQGQVACRATSNCAGGPGDDLGVAEDGSGCCLGNPNALAYTPQGSEECIACVGEF